MFDQITDRALQRRIKRHIIGKEHLFFAVVAPGFEDTLKNELRSLSLAPLGEENGGLESLLAPENEEIRGGVEFVSKLDDAFRYCLLTRGASGVFMRLDTFKSFDWYVLEKGISEFPWELYVHPSAEVVFRSTSRSSMVYHTGKLEEIFRKGISERLEKYSSQDSFSEISGEKEIRLILRNVNNRVQVSLDLTGPDFYKRGDLLERNEAPLRENIAALILMAADFKKYDCLLDPMCGSGTFSIEAAALMRQTPSSKSFFPFMLWPSFIEKRFSHMVSNIRCLGSSSKPEIKIITSDIDPKSVSVAKNNSLRNYGEMINSQVRDFFHYRAEDLTDNTLIVLNPPYGKRIGGDSPLDFYRKIGGKLNGDLKNVSVAVIVPGVEFQKALGLKFSRKVLFKNGGIPSALLIRE